MFKFIKMSHSDIRTPAVAGRFYPAKAAELSKMIEEILLHEKEKINLKAVEKEIFGAVVPHAGYMFSAYQAIHFFELISNYKKKIDTFVILNPNHTGFGEKISMDSHKFWQTPYGNIEQDSEFISSLGFPFSNIAHEEEHSGEVMLPLLQFFVKYDFKVVMLTFSQQNTENAKIIADKIFSAEQNLKRNIMIIASSDFTHFKDAETGSKMDDMVLKQIKNQDTKKLEEIVREKNISVCGYGPIMCLMEYSMLKGVYETEILARGHSGQIIPSDRVVDYITILFCKNDI